MIIKDIHLAGFVNSNPESGLNLSLIENQKILSARSENKRFLFAALLGIIFGFSNKEKEKYRDKNQKVFTGRVDLKFDDYILHIDRDFETDIVAVLSSGSNSFKSVFQDKDIFEKNDRPYAKVLQSLFSINNKQLLLELCDETLNNEQSTFGELLDLLYLFIRPKFKIAAINKLISSSMKVIEFNSKAENGSAVSSRLQDAMNKLHLLKNAKKLAQSRTSLKSDITKFQMHLDNFPGNNPQNDAFARLKQRFPLIYQLDAALVKRDVTRLHALQTSHQRISQRLHEMETKKAELDNLVNKKLLIYANLPDTFEDDFIRYQELSMDQAQYKNDIDRLEVWEDNLQSQLISKKKLEISLQTLILIIIVAFGSIFFTDYLPLVFTSAALVFASIYFIMRAVKKSLITDIEQSEEKRSETKKSLKVVDKEVSELREESYLLDDQEYIDTHIERFKKYKSVKKQIDGLHKEIADFKKQLDDDKYKFDMPHLERKYRDLINLNPPEGLQAYLDEFETIQKDADVLSDEEVLDDRLKPIVKIIENYSNLDAELNKTSVYIEDFLGLEDVDKNIDRRIAELERQITHLKQQIQLENA